MQLVEVGRPWSLDGDGARFRFGGCETIMAGLLIKELVARGDLKRCYCGTRLS